MEAHKAFIDTPDGSFVVGFYDNLNDVKCDFPSKWFDVYHKKDGFHVRRKTWAEVKREMQE